MPSIFKYISEKEEAGDSNTDLILREIAYQLRRQADNTGR